MGFNLADALNMRSVSKLDTTEMKEIKVSLLDPNPNNFFPVEEDITDLCESIKLNGLLQPLVVTPAEGGRYRIIAGHRRHKALQALAEELPDKFGTVLCRVVRPSSPELEELMLIQTNTEARELGWAEKSKSADRVEKILIALQKQGLELPGKMRSHVAKILKTSESQLARAKFIKEHLIKPFADQTVMNDSAAYALAHLPEEQQKELYKHYKNNLWRIDLAIVKNYKENIAAGRDPFYTPPPPLRNCNVQPAKKGKMQPCSHEAIMIARNEKKLPKWQKCDSRHCCSYCTYRYLCEDVCPVIKARIKQDTNSQDGHISAAIRSAREKKGLSHEEAAVMLSSSISAILVSEGACVHTTDSLIKYSKAYDTTPNELLGFDAPTPSATPGSFPQWIPADQIDDLPDGFYTLAYYYRKDKTTGENGLLWLHSRLAQLESGKWYSAMAKLPLYYSDVSKEVLVAVAPACATAPDGHTFLLRGATDDG